MPPGPRSRRRSVTRPLGTPWPSTVEVGGGRVEVNTGWRSNIAADLADMESTGGRTRALSIYFRPLEKAPAAVTSNAAEALGAAIAWHDDAMRCMPYGSPGKRRAGGARQRPVLDWSADAAAICADFLRFYRIDLSDPSTDMHWYRFCALLLALMRYDGSIIGQAVYARSPHPEARGEERKRANRLYRAWALPPTDAELREMARARF